MADRKGRLGKVSLDQVQASRRGQRALKERENGHGMDQECIIHFSNLFPVSYTSFILIMEFLPGQPLQV